MTKATVAFAAANFFLYYCDILLSSAINMNLLHTFQAMTHCNTKYIFIHSGSVYSLYYTEHRISLCSESKINIIFLNNCSLSSSTQCSLEIKSTNVLTSR